MHPTYRFLREFSGRGRTPIATEQTTYVRGTEELAATILRPPSRRPLPGWVVLHGLTVPGREHPSLMKFARAMAASGVIVYMPDIPEWRDLRVAPRVTTPTIDAAVHAIRQVDGVDTDRIGLLGFSFGATQAIVAASHPSVRGELKAVAAWGGYLDLHRLFRFGLIGQHEWGGKEYLLKPDPYGRWIMGGNYLTSVRGYEGYAETAAALFALAREAGTRRIFAGDPAHDPYKLALREQLPMEQRELFDILAPQTRDESSRILAAAELADALATAVRKAEPLLDPVESLTNIECKVFVCHGRDDRLIPFTEALRLGCALPRHVHAGTMITSLYAHSGGTDASLGKFARTVESARFLRMLNRILTLV